ncbi:MAG: Uma2 family endonuclease [Pseudanabaenales cyanobacterium]|nr:Uma2 family endonuclease [Pseudanabaenales cyanobacterium]
MEIDHGIDFTPSGDSTIQKEGQASAQADKSYWFNDRNPTETQAPDLTVEVVIAGEGVTKLKRYRALGVSEVWFWQNGQIHIYNPITSIEAEINESQFVKGDDLSLLARCAESKTMMTAIKCFRQGGY